jgi:murein DD-endopeptidase MepM/ murein hydrolase activator NlpD
LRNILFGILIVSATAAAAVSIRDEGHVAKAQNVDELKDKIDESNDNIRKLEQEIAEYQTQVAQIGKEADTLKNAVLTLDISRKKLLADLQVNEDKIHTANLVIQKLGLEIGDKSQSIQDNVANIGEALKEIHRKDSTPVVESLLAGEDLGAFWTDVDNLETYQAALRTHITELEDLKVDLQTDKSETEAKKAELEALKKELADRKAVLEANQKEKATLLAATQSKESLYKAIIDEKMAKKQQFEQELFDYESKLKIAIDPKSIPASGKGVIKWPLDTVSVTQYFGNTSFSTANPQIYNGKGHTGIDLRAAPGTKVKAALTGVVTGVGNTDLVKGCYSYGKWILIKHPNGLSTLYAHLSGIAVGAGEEVKTGQLIGYSGNTGYSTGPHLHFGVYATQGVRVENYTQSINCKGAWIPLADPKAYLNPLSYL